MKVVKDELAPLNKKGPFYLPDRKITVERDGPNLPFASSQAPIASCRFSYHGRPTFVGYLLLKPPA
jgi:hypothetical protein